MPRMTDILRGTDNMSDALMIALEASWENDPVRMEDIWERMDRDPDEKTYRTKPEQKEKA